MTEPVPMVQITRGPFVESVHRGHAVVMHASGDMVEAWGEPGKIVLPRSSAKMLQALPLLESGAGQGLATEQLALACSSHSAEQRHVDRVDRWLGDLGLTADALCCGAQPSRDVALQESMIREGRETTRTYNWCSGKHAGFLTVARHLGASLDYVDPQHPVQKAVKEAVEDMCDETSPGFGIDGCSAPNYAVSLSGMARAMARFASDAGTSARGKAIIALREAMITHPEMVAGRGRASTELMQAAKGRVAIKDGAEGFFVAIVPDLQLGVALKMEDGAGRGSEIAMAAILAKLGVLDPSHPVVARYLKRPVKNWDGLLVGEERPAAALS